MPVDDPSQPPTAFDALIASLDSSETAPVVLVNPHGTIVFVTARYVSATGYHRHECVGRAMVMHLHPDDRATWQTWLVGIDRPVQGSVTARLRMRNGTWRRYGFEIEWRDSDHEAFGILRLHAPSGAETAAGTCEQGPRCNVHQTILGLEPILRRVAGLSVDVFYRLDATAVHVSMTPFQLEQVLVHLVSNARHAMPAGGVLRIGTSNRLTTSADPTAAVMCQLTLSVSDTGAGLNPRVSPRIFEPFFTTKSDRGHAGLGLTIVQRLVETAGGHIDVDSVMGQGTTFNMHFPAVTVAGAVSSDEAEQPCVNRETREH